MAIELEQEIGNSGITANYFVLSSVHSYRDSNTESFYAAAQYDLYLDRAAFEAGKAPVRSSATQVKSAADALRDLPEKDFVAHFDALAVAPGVDAVFEEVEAEVGVAVGGAEAEAKEPVLVSAAVAAGPLAGGKIVP